MTSETLRNMLVKQEPRPITNCYVCAGTRADYPLYSKPYGERPFFPFLEHHTPPEGAEPIALDGRVFVCSLCYTFLTQQWESYERSKTPHSKRIYWLKRLDNGPFAGMEVNLQQDYESLFDSSNAYDPESKHKQRQSKSFQAYAESKKKLGERSESRDSSASNLSARCDRFDVSSTTCVNSALDLSMPSRTSSQSSSASPPAATEGCFICGTPSKTLCNVFTTAIPNCPFFPSLAHHPRPANARPMDDSSRIHVCDTCYRNLIHQWDFYQRQNVPHSERSYDIKFCPPSSSSSSSTSTPVTKQESTVPENSFVCFTCGMVAQTSIQRIIRSYPEREGEPYFSFLLHISPCPGAEPLSDGKAKVCSLCYKSLSRQLRVFELSSVPEDQRKYKIHSSLSSEEFSVLRRHLKGSGSQPQQHQTAPKVVCYLCEKVVESPFFISAFPKREMHFPFIASLPRPACAEPLGKDGSVKVCHECHSSLKFQWDAFEHAKIPINQRQYKIPAVKTNHSSRSLQLSNLENAPSHSNYDGVLLKQQLAFYNTCCLCLRQLSEENAHVLETMPRQDGMYFPFIRSYLKVEDHKRIDPQGRILACTLCHSLLKNQWDLFEAACVPHLQRQYRLLPPVAQKEVKVEAVEDTSSNTSSVLHIQVSSPEVSISVSKNASNSEPLLTTVNTLVVSNVITSRAQSSMPSHTAPDGKAVLRTESHSSSEDGKLRVCGPFDVLFGKPLMLNAVCFVCGETSVSSPMYIAHSRSYGSTPFFPFLAKHPIPEGAERLSEEGGALVCVLCYHSLMSQYLAYEASSLPEDANRWQRKYNTYNYVCYVCGAVTVRRRACSLPVGDFPFLLEHPRPLGSLTLMNGECVVACVSCFDFLMVQWKEYVCMKVPVALRKYKLLAPVPHASERSAGLGTQDPSSLPLQQAGDESDLRTSQPSEGQGLSHGSKPPPHVPVQSLYNSKPSSRAVALSSPVHPNASHSSAAFVHYENSSSSSLNASRTSSFAAALRKLAKQAIEPIAEREMSPVRSPSMNHQPSASKPIAPSTLYRNASNHESAFSSAAQSTMGAPSQAHSTYIAEKRKDADMGRYQVINNSSSSAMHGGEGASFLMDYSKTGNSHDDRRCDSLPERKPSPLYPPHHRPSSREEHAFPRGFQPYRAPEESMPPSVQSQVHERSSPVAGVYSHQSYPPTSSLSQPYRLEDSVYMERYTMIRPPAVPYPPSNVLPYPSLPFYPSTRYPPELIAQPLSSAHSSLLSGERSKSEDSHRERNPEAGHGREMHHTREKEHRDHGFAESAVESKGHKIYSPIPLQAGRTESPHDHLAPVNYAGSHDVILRKPSPPLAAAPLNLVKHSAPASSYAEESASWNPKLSQSSNGHSYSAPAHHKNMFESSMDTRARFPPPPLISEVSSSYQAQKNVLGAEDYVNKGISVPGYPKSSHFMGGDYSRSSTPQQLDASIPVNGIPVRDSYSHRLLPEKTVMHKRLKEVPSSLDKRTESRLPVKSGQTPSSDLVMHQPSSDKLQRDLSGSHEQYQNSSSGYFDYSTKAHPSNLAPNHSQHLVPKDASITRALLQNHITPSIIEKYIHPSEELAQNVMSKLDQRESRLRKRRLLTGDPDYELSDSDSDEEEQRKLKEFLILTKVKPLPLDKNPQKLEFLEKFGLTTHPKKQVLEWKKYVRRKRVLREISDSNTDGQEESIGVILCDPKRLEELSRRLCIEDNSEDKAEFMRMLNLCPKMPVPGRAQSKVVSESKVPEVKMFAPVEDVQPSISQPEEIPEYHHKKRRTLLSGMQLNSAKKLNCPVNGMISNEHLSPMRGIPSLKPVEPQTVSSLKSTSKPVPSSLPPLIPSEKCGASDTSLNVHVKPVVLSQDPRVKLLDKTFAQEFHESVLQATQKQLGQKISSSSSSSELLLPKLSPPLLSDGESRSSISGDNRRFILNWPGIEAIMESYEYYISEQSVEKDFLAERCRRLRESNQELSGQIACLGQKTSALLQKKTCLENERQALEATVNSFKAFIHRFR